MPAVPYKTLPGGLRYVLDVTCALLSRRDETLKAYAGFAKHPTAPAISLGSDPVAQALHTDGDVDSIVAPYVAPTQRIHPASFVKPVVMPYEPTGQYGHAPPLLYVPNGHCALTISAFVKKHATKRVAIITPLAHVLFITNLQRQ